MKTLVAAFITAILVFALATAWTEMVQPRLEMLAFSATSKSSEASTKSSTKRGQRTAIDRDLDEDPDDLDAEPVPKVTGKSSRVAKQRAETAKKDRLMVQLEQVKLQESKLLERQAMMELLYQDIRKELAEVDEIRRKSAAELALAERRMVEGIATKTNVAARTIEADDAAKTVAKQRVATEASIANLIQELASKGNVRDAALLLSELKDREVAKVLMSLYSRNPSLALQLSDKVNDAKQGIVRQ